MGQLTTSLRDAGRFARELNAELARAGGGPTTRAREIAPRATLATRALGIEMGRRFDILERLVRGGAGNNRTEVRIGGLT